jgi:heavy metal sensor kinase
MTLTNRLTAYFLGALTLVLAAFSVALYLLAHAYLERQTDERVENALDTLVAAIDISEGFLEWEGHERHLTLGKDEGPTQVRWTVHAADGSLIAKSDNLQADDLDVKRSARWRVADRTILGDPSVRMPASSKKDDAPKHSQLRVTAAVSLQSQDSTLFNLAWALMGLSAAVLMIAALAGRWFCRRALAPVSAMAGAARAMTAAHLDARLPISGNADELAELEHAFNDLLTRLQEAFERQRRFTGDASHQLRTPLAAVLGQVEVALRRDRSPGEYREVLRRALGQGEQLQKIVESLLFLARTDGESRLPDLQEVDLADWLPNHLERWRDHRRWPDLMIETEPCRVFVQSALLGQLIDNLLDNACKYSAPGQAIAVQVRRRAQEVLVSVEDAGAGIAAEDVPHLFEPFFRSSQARRDGKAGVGLGLAIARRIAAALGGRLDLDRSTSRGSRFILRLPAA